MANIVITAASGSLKIDFGDYAAKKKVIKGTFNSITEITELFDGGVLIIFAEKRGMINSLLLSFNGENGDKVDLINGAPPANDSAIYTTIDSLTTA